MPSVDRILKDISDAANEGRLAFFVGAGVSRAAPTLMPTALEIVDTILFHLSRCLPNISTPLLKYHHYMTSLPFEGFLSIVAQGIGEKALQFLVGIRNGMPNARHQFIGTVLSKKMARLVLTTNFDNSLETSISATDNTRIRYGLRDRTALMSDDFSGIWKLHGSFVDEAGRDISHSIITTVESTMRSSSKPALQILTSALQSNVTVFLGYSGNDTFDVIPALRMAPNARVIWIDHYVDSEPTREIHDFTVFPKHLHEIFSRTTCSVLQCDTDVFLKKLATTISMDYPIATQAPVPSRSNMAATFDWHEDLAPLTAGLLFLSLDLPAQNVAIECLNLFLAQHLSDDEHKAYAHVALAQANEALCGFDAALSEYERGMGIFRKLRNESRIARTLGDMAVCYLRQGRFDKALDMLQSAKAIAQKSSDEETSGIILHNLGCYYEHVTKGSEAVEAFEEAIGCFERCGNPRRLASSTQDLYYTVLRFNIESYLTNKSIYQVLKTVEFEWATGINSHRILSKTNMICAELYERLYGSLAFERAREEPILYRTQRLTDIQHCIHVLRQMRKSSLDSRA